MQYSWGTQLNLQSGGETRTLEFEIRTKSERTFHEQSPAEWTILQGACRGPLRTAREAAPARREVRERLFAIGGVPDRGPTGEGGRRGRGNRRADRAGPG